MAHRGNAKVLPMYLSKRKKWYHRQRIVMGAPIDISEKLGKIPTMQAVNDMTEYLREKEIELRKYLDDNYPKNKSKKGENE